MELVKSKLELETIKVTTDTVSSRKKEMLKEEALDIYNLYIVPDSACQVNLPGPIVDKINEKIKAEKFEFKMYQDAKAEVFALMSKDSFARFQGSDEYKELLKKLGVYEQKRASE